MLNNGFKAISESLIYDIQECPITRGEFGTFTYLMLKANYMTHKALGSFSNMAEDLGANRQQIANDCYNLREYGWIDFEVKQGQRKSILFTILKGWWDNEQYAARNQLANNSHVSSKSVASAKNAVSKPVDTPGITPTCYQPANNSHVDIQLANNSHVNSKSVASHSHVSSKSGAPPDAPGSVPIPNSADLVSADNTEHGTQNMKQQRLRGKKGNLESPDNEDVVVSNFCYEEENSADSYRKESPYVAELCDLFANAYGEILPAEKAQEWILEYGINRCKEVITKGNPDPDNPIGYVQKALEENWQFKDPPGLRVGDHRAKHSFGIATPSVSATRALIDELKATWAEKQNPTAEEIAEVDAMLINAGLKDPPF